jgi:hypothetical protein
MTSSLSSRRAKTSRARPRTRETTPPALRDTGVDTGVPNTSSHRRRSRKSKITIAGGHLRRKAIVVSSLVASAVLGLGAIGAESASAAANPHPRVKCLVLIYRDHILLQELINKAHDNPDPFAEGAQALAQRIDLLKLKVRQAEHDFVLKQYGFCISDA